MWNQIVISATDAIMQAGIKVFITFPITLAFISIALKMGMAEKFGYPCPTKPQTVLLAVAIVLLS